MATNGDASSLWDESRQLGQLFAMGFDGTAVNDQVRILIETYFVGTILLTAKNLRSAAQTTQLVLDLQTIARNAGHPVPLLIAIDQENGGVNSLYDEGYIRQFPSAMGVAATGSKRLAREIAKATAQELGSCGVNWIWGPVLDVLTNTRSQPLGSRSFGDDPQEVSAFGVESLKGYRDGGLATCGKHFPSYGNLEFFGAPTDVPTITESLEQLSQGALIPFRTAISNGIDAMMVGGVAMTSSNMNVMHACLSERIVQDLLRHSMQFQGVVVSECLEMEALSRNIGISGGTVMAFKAGCDIILTCRSLSVQEEAINGLKVGLDNGMIERYRVQESVRRVLELKAKYTSWEAAFAPPGIQNLMRLEPSHTALATTTYNKSITVVRDQKQFLPLSKTLQADSELLLMTPLLKPLPASAAARQLSDATNMPSPDPVANSETSAAITSGERVFREFGKSLARRRPGKLSHTSYTQNGLRPVHENLLARADAIIILTADAGRNMYQSAFTKHASMLCRMNMGFDGRPKEKPCIVVSASSPFDFAADTTVGTYVCTYDFTEAALQTLVKVLFGEIAPTGLLPGAIIQGQKSSQARQQWLVESFNEQRDSKALDTLLASARRDRSPSSRLLTGISTATFLLRSADVEEAHFVVRNSSTKELFGFCSTYFFKSTATGHIGAIIVDPDRRKLSIGHSLHDRAIRALFQHQGIKTFHLGSRIPSIFLGIPNTDNSSHTRLSKWFTKLGWNTNMSTSVCSMMLTGLSSWTAPTGLGQTLANADVKYDLVHGTEYAEVVLGHVRNQPRQAVQEIYKIALENRDACGIIRAKRALDGTILGSVVLIHRTESKLVQYIPILANPQMVVGGISSPIISPLSEERESLMQGLVLLGVRQLKRQGAHAVFIDCIDDDAAMDSLTALGFETLYRFDEVASDPATWAAMASG